MMQVKVELQAYLAQYSPDGQTVFGLELPAEASVNELLRSLGVPDELASVVIVNDINAELSHQLQDGDRVTVIPPLAGG